MWLFLISLILTIILEFFVFLIFRRDKILNIFIYAVVINLLTNPLANLFNSYINILIIELFVFIIEIFLIKYLFEVSYKKATLMSFSANLVSFLIGNFLLGYFHI
jgi:hypothetical protein